LLIKELTAPYRIGFTGFPTQGGELALVPGLPDVR
jgi:hypothetical protein